MSVFSNFTEQNLINHRKQWRCDFDTEFGNVLKNVKNNTGSLKTLED